MSFREIKEDLVAEAEVLIYQIKAAQLFTDYETISNKAETLTNLCKKLKLIQQEEERIKKELNF